MTWGSQFCAGASYYGISDLSLLAQETHKFESRYLDSLIGKLPFCSDTYLARSPSNNLSLQTKATIFFQGTEDKVVPPNQSEKLYQVLKQKNIMSELVLYEGEQHGFRKAKNIQDALEREYHFYLEIFKNSKFCKA